LVSGRADCCISERQMVLYTVRATFGARIAKGRVGVALLVWSFYEAPLVQYGGFLEVLTRASGHARSSPDSATPIS
jgi:hypothetical protein